ncbi:hypothetical protein, partial [Candidatus Nitrosocosmicus sp. SS]
MDGFIGNKKNLKIQHGPHQTPIRDVEKIVIDPKFLPIEVYNNNVDTLLSRNSNFNKVLAIVIGTKPDFYKQAPV